MLEVDGGVKKKLKNLFDDPEWVDGMIIVLSSRCILHSPTVLSSACTS
jgi:hypothetical protein